MSQFSEDLKKVYSKLHEQNRELNERSAQLSRVGREEKQAWPKLRQHLGNKTFPALKKRIEDLDKALTPFDLDKLQEAKRELKRLPRLTWWNPWAFRVRMANFGIRTLFFGFRVLQLAAILLILYGLVRVIWFLV